MIRKMLTATTVIAALLLSVLSFGGLTADAGRREATSRPSTQSAPTPNLTLARSPTCLHLLLGLTVWAHLTHCWCGPCSSAASDGVAGLAQTGSESAVLAYAGAGLIAFGAVALGSRRRFFQGTLEV